VVVHAWTDLAEAERLSAPAATDRGAGPGVGPEAGPDGRGAALATAWALFRGRFAADEPYAASLDEPRRTAERLQLDVAEAVVVAGMEGSGAAGATGGRATSERLPLTLELLVAAAAHVLAVEPWRTDVVRDVAAACRAAGDEVQARRAERLALG
jgi:hypothetical protein